MRLLFLKGSDGGIGIRNFADDQKIPEYAILSHTWGREEDEMTLDDIFESRSNYSKPGYQKLQFCGRQANEDGLLYFWVDTCCIDKRNAVELQEAITSMFRWYQKASKCYVFLSDVSKRASLEDDHLTWEPQFAKSRWFNRGKCLGDKESLEQQLHQATGISVRAIQGEPLSNFSVEERMSWAGHRLTKRGEDKSYSLMGIFDVSFFVIYGCGEERAFERLREEIEKQRWRWEVINAYSVRKALSSATLLWFCFAISIIGVALLMALGGQDSYPRELPQFDRSIPIFALIGKTGVGKSTFIDLLGGKTDNGFRPEVCHGLTSCTSNLTFYRATINTGIENESVYLIDTPGFDDSREGMTDHKIMHMIFSELLRLYNGDKLVKGLIFLHDITQARIGGLALKHFDAFESLCGKDAFDNVILVTTKWRRTTSYEELLRETERHEELRTKYWRNMIDRGAYLEKHEAEDDYYSAHRILMMLLHKPRIRFTNTKESAEEDDDAAATAQAAKEGSRPSVSTKDEKQSLKKDSSSRLLGKTLVILLVLGLLLGLANS